jgi:hypothetical protein
VNFFMVGAPKTATTTIAYYLRRHANVFMCDPKEPYFFCSDVGPSPFARNCQQYLELFSAVTQEHQVVAEASASYLMSEVACQNIYDFNPSAKILVTLRNPVDLVQAWHSEMLYAGEESETSFEHAWQLQGERASGDSLPILCTRPLLLQYERVGLIGAGLQKFIKRFSRSQVAWIVFDDFRADPRAEYRRLLEFLELPIEIPERFETVNRNKQHRVALLGRSVRYLRQRFASPINLAYGVLGVHSSGIMSQLDRLNTRVVQRPVPQTGFRDRLKAVFRTDIQLLEGLIDRDLSAWYR